jgi:hypothetical protein
MIVSFIICLEQEQMVLVFIPAAGFFERFKQNRFDGKDLHHPVYY